MDSDEELIRSESLRKKKIGLTREVQKLKRYSGVQKIN